MTPTMLVDISRCIGCRACQIACKEWNLRKTEHTAIESGLENPPDLSAQTWTRVKFIEEAEGETVTWQFRRVLCQHCTDAACEQVCPTKAISHMSETAVVIDPDKCTGCKYCISACPFDVPRFNPENNKVEKCTFCIDRLREGMTPACAKVCAPGAVVFGDKTDIRELARQRVARLKKKGISTAGVYGEKELGGLGVLMLLTSPPSVYGLPEEPSISVSIGLWRDVMKPLIAIAGGGAGLAALASLAGSVGYKRSKGDKGGK